MSRRYLALLTLVLLLFITSAVAARSPAAPELDLPPTGVLRAGDGAGGHRFGADIALQGHTAAIGAPGWNNEHGSYTGAVYIFTHIGSAWAEITRLMASDARAYEAYGASVELEGETLVVGASRAHRGEYGDPDFAPNAGAVYVYTGSGAAWAEQVRLQPADLVDVSDFGGSLDLDGDTLFIGAPEYDGRFTEVVYAYERTGDDWGTPQKLSGPDPAGNHQFGLAVAVAGDVALVGAPGISCCSQSSPFEKGVVYVFTRNGGEWLPAGSFMPVDGFPGDNFGCDIAFDGTTAVIAACQAYGLSEIRGYAYIFTRNGSTWTQTARLEPEGDAIFVEGIGAVLLDGDRLLLGTTGIPNAPSSGRVYPYRLDGGNWIMEMPIAAPSDGLTETRFGSALALNDWHLLAGASFLPLNEVPQQGGVYTFDAPFGNDYVAYTPIVVRPIK